MRIKSAWALIKGTFNEFTEDNVLRLSAALAYYAIFSIGPLLAIVIGLAGLAFGSESVHHHVHQQAQSLVGDNAAKLVDSMASARQQSGRSGSLITTIIGIVALLFGAAGVFGQLQDSLNTIWEVKAKPGKGIWGYVRTRFLSFSMVLGIGFLLLVSLAVSAALAALTHSLSHIFPVASTLAHVVDFAVSFGVVTVLFATIFKFLPDVKIPWSKVWIGAIGTTILFTIGKMLLAWYLGRQSTASAYGAAGSVIVVLMWIYYASVILFFGAEFTQVYAKRTGARVVPSHYAEPVTEDERAQQGMPPRKKVPNQPGPQPQSAPVLAKTGVASKTMQERGPAIRRTASISARPKSTSELLWTLAVTGFVAGALFKYKKLRRVAKFAVKLVGAV